MEIPFALAFSAGLVATVNPCGFAMLPAYLSYYVGSDGSSTTGGHDLRRGLTVAAVMSGGFLAVFGVAGALISIGVRAVIDALPWAAMVVGVGLVGLGLAMLTGFELRVRLPGVSRTGDTRGLRGMFAFGVSYAVASLSCTLPVFLVVIVGSIAQQGTLAGIATFLVYGAGMSTLLVVVTVAIVIGKRAIVTWLRRSSRYLNRASGVILAAAGGYIVAFWSLTLRDPDGGQPALVTTVEQLSSMVTNRILGSPGSIAKVAIVLVATIGGMTALRAHRARPTARDHVEEPDPSR